MELKVSALILFSLAVVVTIGPTFALTATESTERNIFASDLYQAIATQKINENVVISPAAIQTSMALAYYGAKGKTASEMQSGLRLGSSDPEDVVRRFGEFQQTWSRENNIRLSNNVYINQNFEFKAKFRETAQRNFDSNIEKVDFHPPYNTRTANDINKAIETKTDSKITDIVSATILNDLTEGVITNGATFGKATWQKAFRADKTKQRPFKSGRQTYSVDTMWTLNNFKYGEFSNLDAKIVDLPYQNTDFSMLLIVPNNDDGLANLVQRLSGKDLLGLVKSGLSNQKVEVILPKFKITFGVDLVEPFKTLGVTTMFTRSGDFGNMYRMFTNHYINTANHKAYIEIGEEGVEPALETGILKSLFSRNQKVEADHPFIFAIKHKDSIIFIGHVANFA